MTRWPSEAETELDFIAALSTIQEERGAQWIAGALQSMYAADEDNGPVEKRKAARKAEQIFHEAYRRFDASEPGMNTPTKSWRYRFVEQPRFVHGVWHLPLSGTHKPLPPLVGTESPSELLHMLGAEGWELCCVDDGLYIFKRPVEEKTT